MPYSGLFWRALGKRAEEMAEAGTAMHTGTMGLANNPALGTKRLRHRLYREHRGRNAQQSGPGNPWKARLGRGDQADWERQVDRHDLETCGQQIRQRLQPFSAGRH